MRCLGPFSQSIPEDMMEKSKLPCALVHLGARSCSASASTPVPETAAAAQSNSARSSRAKRSWCRMSSRSWFRHPRCCGARDRREAAGAANASAGRQHGRRANTSRDGYRHRRSRRACRCQDADGEVLFHAPVTVGSENDPLAGRRMEGQRRRPQPGIQLQPEPVLGRRSGARESQDSRRPEQSRRESSGSISARNTTAFTARPNPRASATPSRTAAFA